MKDLGRIRQLFHRDDMLLSEILRKPVYSRSGAYIAECFDTRCYSQVSNVVRKTLRVATSLITT